ncbi:MAG: transposase [Arenicella sp.]|jgi:transposase
MRKKTFRVYKYEFSDGVLISCLRREDLRVKPRRGKCIILSGCSRKSASHLHSRLRKGLFIHHYEY